MTTQKQLLLIFTLLVLIANIAFGQSNISSIVNKTIGPSGLIHPGILNNKNELDLLRADLESGNKFRADLYKHVTEKKEGRLNNPYKAAPADTIIAFESNAFKYDAQSAYIHALLYILTEDAAHAEIAINILNAWASTLKAIVPKPDDKNNHALLFGGIYIGAWVNSAELLKYSGAPWNQADQDKFSGMVSNVFLGQCLTDYRSNYNGNWDLANEWSRLACYVWLDDKDGFDEVLSRIKEGPTNGSVLNYIRESGQNQETGRDQNHVQMGLEFIAYCAEIAWNQGEDIYEYKSRSIGKAFEYTAKYNLGYDVPFEVYDSPVGNNSHDNSTKPGDHGRGDFNPIYERVYHHYHDRLNVELPMVKKVLEEKTRIKTWGGIWFSRWDDFICANLSVPCPLPDKMNVNACGSYTSPSGKHLWYSSGSYLDTINNANCNESIIRINLEIDSVDTSVSVNGTTLIANANDARYQWLSSNDAIDIVKGNNKSYTPKYTGDYMVKIDLEGCVDTTKSYTVSTSNVLGFDNYNSTIIVYPNPTTGIAYISCEWKDYKAVLYSMNGRVIQKNIHGFLDMSKVKKGTYFLEINSSNKNEVKKITKR